MIARISSGRSPAGAVFYNEQKVGKGEAERLALRNFEGIRIATQSLTPSMVAGKLEERAAINERIQKPTFHVSLAMAKDEFVPMYDLIAIADQYMQGMGYARQPYVIYQHYDTEHPHIHIVSVRVDTMGKKISDSFEREKSNTLRQQIEKDFGLKVAENVTLRPEKKELKPIEYGKGDLKSDISDVVQGVLRDFTFSSFAQYNQLLKIYNVQAVEVVKEGQMPGMRYSAIDADGKQVGAGIKASSLPYRPNRETVERRIKAGKKIKGDRVGSLRKVAASHLSQSEGWSDFQHRLSRLGVEVIPHLGKDENLFGISYLDTKQRTIYTGSELGKTFTAGSLKNTLGENYQPLSEQGMKKAKQPLESIESGKADIHQAQSIRETPSNQQSEEDLSGNAGLMRQLLYALRENSSLHESEQDLKKMIKKSRKTQSI